MSHSNLVVNDVVSGGLCPILSAVDNCNHGDVRLVNGSVSWEGRVEVCWNGTWGTVCGNTFNRATASVVCRQAGFLADIGW